MQKFNIHTHTTRCNHAVGSDEEYVIKAIENGLSVLGFSDHVPFDKQRVDEHRMLIEEKEEYLTSIRHLKEKYKDQIDIKIGFECEYFKEYDAYYKILLSEVDYLILGQHLDDQKSFDYCQRATDEDIKLYQEMVCEGIKTGYFTYLAHPEYFMLAREDFNQVCYDAIYKIAKTCVEMNIPVEMNLKGLSYGLKDYKDGKDYAYPHSKAIEIFSIVGNTAVFGLDVHDPKKFDEMHHYIDTFYQVYPNKMKMLNELTLRNIVLGDSII